MYIRF